MTTVQGETVRFQPVGGVVQGQVGKPKRVSGFMNDEVESVLVRPDLRPQHGA